MAMTRKALTPCSAPAASSNSLISFIDTGAMDSLYVHPPSGSPSESAAAQWLMTTYAAGEVEQQKLREAEAQREVDAAIAEPNAQRARAMVDKAKSMAAMKWAKQRKKLVAFVNTTRGLSHGGIVLSRPRSSSESATIASCVFDVEQAVIQLAALATSVNDAARTCPSAPQGADDGPAGKVCGLNAVQILASAAAMAASLSLAAANCATTLVPGFVASADEFCAGSIAGLVQSLMEFSIGAQLTAATCQEKGVPAGVAPSTIGQGGRRLEGAEANSSARARRLLFGGGIGATSAFCAVDVDATAWYLAQAALAINAAANPKAGATCPPRKGTHMHAYKQAQAFCAVDVTGAIYGFLQAIKYIQYAVVHCADEWNIPALCGAGIDGMIASASGFAYAGSGVHIACDLLRHHKARLSPGTRSALRHNALGNSGSFGRRLEDDAGLRPPEGASLARERFANPEEVWKSLGYDISSLESPVRDAQPPRPSPVEVSELLQEDASTATTSGLFGGQHLCS